MDSRRVHRHSAQLLIVLSIVYLTALICGPIFFLQKGGVPLRYSVARRPARPVRHNTAAALVDHKFRKTLHRGWTALRIIKFRKRRFSGVKLWPGATCGPEICMIYNRILVAKSAGFITGFWKQNIQDLYQDSGSKVWPFPAANYRAALLVDGDVSHAEGPSGHIEKFSDMGNFRPAPHFRAF